VFYKRIFPEFGDDKKSGCSITGAAAFLGLFTG
jgi:hypothetical protein